MTLRDTSVAEPTPGEGKAMDAIVEAMHAVQEIDGDLLKYNSDELVQAVHTLQSFVKQHVLFRIDPEHWADWYGDRNNW